MIFRQFRFVLPRISPRLLFRLIIDEASLPKSSGADYATRIIATVLLSCLGLPALQSAKQPPHYNVVFILADDLRADALGAFGGGQVPTPHLDRLAERGTAFSSATCGYPICNVSRSEVIVGRSLVGARTENGPYPGLELDPSWVRWPALMQSSGWRTVYSGKWHITGTPWENGYDETVGLFSSGGSQGGDELTITTTPTGREVTGYRGWTFKDDDNQPQLQHGTGLTPTTDTFITDESVGAIHRLAGQPFFLHVNYTAPHDPLLWPKSVRERVDPALLTVPENFQPEPGFETGNTHGRDEVIVPAPRSKDDVIQERALYFTLVGHLDAQVGRLIRALEETGELSQTIIIFASDHGLAMGSHGLMGKQNQYEHSINVPLIIAGPQIPTGRLLSTQCYLRDLYPTVCDLVGIAAPSTVQARSLLPVLQGDRAEVHESIFGYYTGTQRMIRDPDGWKLIWYPEIGKQQLFDVARDPSELHDLSRALACQAKLKDLKRRLATWQNAAEDPLVKATKQKAQKN